MSVVAQLPPELGGASGKVGCSVHLLPFPNRGCQVAYIDTEGSIAYGISSPSLKVIFVSRDVQT